MVFSIQYFDISNLDWKIYSVIHGLNFCSYIRRYLFFLTKLRVTPLLTFTPFTNSYFAAVVLELSLIVSIQLITSFYERFLYFRSLKYP